MRLSVETLRQVVKRDWPITFVPQQLTAYGGLELLRRYLRRLELPRRLHAACAGLGGDYSGAPLGVSVAATCKVPALHIAATPPLNPPHLMSQWMPTAVNGMTVGAGHFNQLDLG